MRKDTTEIEDEKLIVACRRGDAVAWETLVNRYQRLIYTIPRRAGLDEDLAAEVFQRTFTILWQHIDRLDQPGRVRSWLVTTARREAQRLAQRQSRTVPLETNDAPQDDAAAAAQELVAPDPLPDELLLQLEQQHLVRTKVAALDERCAQLLTFLFYTEDGLPYTEVAAKLGLPAGSIGPTRARCLQKLRRLLEDDNF